jgi:hypothetical protein
MNSKPVAILLFGDSNSTRNALTDEGFKPLADALLEAGFAVESVLYHDEKAEHLLTTLQNFAAVLVWVDPIVQGMDRQIHLDPLLLKLSECGVLVTTHPELIEKIGTKKVLYTSRSMEWGGDVELYPDYEDFVNRFVSSLNSTSIRILKQHRGSSGSGIYKVSYADYDRKLLRVVHARTADQERIVSIDEFHTEFRALFADNAPLINQQWVDTITNGMVRCYITGGKVGGFGYQEAIALCPHPYNPQAIRPTSRRYYFSEDCGLFQDLRQIMEDKWIPRLQEIHAIPSEAMPLLWDADFFINDVNTKQTASKYTLCEINVSCVSPFPPSCVGYMVEELKTRLAVVIHPL